VNHTTLTQRLAIGLVIYLLVVGLGTAAFLVAAFPKQDNGTTTFPLPLGSADQQLLILALAAGFTGSFIHSAQSLSSYLGNETFKASWTVWYVLRPWIGGILGFAIYFAFRAGLVAGASVVNPYGVVALGLLGGWFSKTTADKLQEVFETLFRTDEDSKRKDKLVRHDVPVVDEISPSTLHVGQNTLTITGRNFIDGATVVVDGTALTTHFISERQLRATFENTTRPSPGSTVSARVENPHGHPHVSPSRTLHVD
jgi:hypothetical protein